MKRILLTTLFVLALATVAVAQTPRQVNTQTAIFEAGYVQVRGLSAPNQDEFSAITAATADAQVRLLRIIQRINIAQNVTVEKGMTLSNTVQTSINGSLSGAYVLHEYYDAANGAAKVWMRLNLKGQGSVYQKMAPVIQQMPQELNIPKLPEFRPQPAAPAPKPEPVVYDGLIVLVEGTGFKPALANRIITESQDVLFEPSKVSPQMLIERGCGGYTTTQDKAKALLATWGAKQPMVVKCTKVMKGTEAVVSVKDATMIFEQNQKTNILPQAKVVFVL